MEPAMQGDVKNHAECLASIMLPSIVKRWSGFQNFCQSLQRYKRMPLLCETLLEQALL